MADNSKAEQSGVVQDNMFGEPKPVPVRAVGILPNVVAKEEPKLPFTVKWADPDDLESPMERVVGPAGVGSERLKK